MINKKHLDTVFLVLENITCIVFLIFGIGLIAENSKKLNFQFITAIKNIISELNTTKDITGENLNSLLYIVLILSGFILIGFLVPFIIEKSHTIKNIILSSKDSI